MSFQDIDPTEPRMGYIVTDVNLGACYKSKCTGTLRPLMDQSGKACDGEKCDACKCQWIHQFPQEPKPEWMRPKQ